MPAPHSAGSGCGVLRTSGNSAAACAALAPRAIKVTGARAGSSSSCRVRRNSMREMPATDASLA